MALSGRLAYANIQGGRWRLGLEWDATQNISANRSYVTARLYWEGTDQYSRVYSNQSNESGIQYNNGGFSTEYHSPALYAGQKKLVNTYSFTIDHNADGTGSFSLDGYFDIQVTLSGTYYGRIDLTQQSFSLNTIPRKSTLTSSPSFTAGGNRAISINPASNSFTHRAYIDVKDKSGNWVFIKSVDFGAGDTYQWANFSVADNTQIFQTLDGRASCDMRINLHTYNGGDNLGYNTYNGTVTAPSTSYINKVNGLAMNPSGDGYHQYAYVDQSLTLNVVRFDSEFTHTVQISCGSFTKTFNNVSTSVTWNPTTTEQNLMYAEFPNATSEDGNMRVWTYYNGVLVRSYADADLNFYIRNAEPIFSPSAISYADVNGSTMAITANDQYIIQDNSDLRAYVNTMATAQKGASLVKYIVSVGGIEKTLSTATGSVDIGKISASSNQSLSIKAVDTRGLSTTVYKTVSVIPYRLPDVNADAQRQNQFEDRTTLESSGTFSEITIGGSNKNLISSLQYRYKEKGTTTWTAWANIPFTTVGGTFAGTDIIVYLDNLKAFDFEVKTTDKLNSNIQTTNVSTGKPIWFIDSELNSVGINKFPTRNNALEVEGELDVSQSSFFGGNVYFSNAPFVEGQNIYVDPPNTTGGHARGLKFRDDIGNDIFELGMLGSAGKKTYGYIGDDYINTNVRFYGDKTVFNRTVEINADLNITYSGIHSTGYSYVQAGGFFDVRSDYGLRVKNYDDTGFGTMEMALLTVYGNGDSVQFYGNDHFYMEYFAKGDSANRSGWIGYGSSATEEFTVNNDIGTVQLDSQGASFYVGGYASDPRVWSDAVYNRTYSYSPNSYVTSAGTLGRSTSASKYKLAIEKAKTEERAEKILDLELKSWYDKTASEQLAEYETMKMKGKKLPDHLDVPPAVRHYGLVAEDIVEAGLTEYVAYGYPDENGVAEVEGIQYDRLWTLLIPIVRKQKNQIETLQKELQVMKSIQTNGGN